MVHRRRVGRPKAPLARARHRLTERVRALLQLAHDGNLREASRATAIPYATLRELYTGQTINPSYRTLAALVDTYGVPLEWLRSEEEPEDVPLLGRRGFVPPHPARMGSRPQLREVLIPFAAWPMYDVVGRLEAELTAERASPERPIVGEATGEAMVFRLTTFLFQPLLAAERAGQRGVIIEAREIGGLVGGIRWREWVERLRSLGEMWRRVLPDLVGGR